MNRSNFALEHQGEVSREPYGRDLPHLSVDLTHDTRMPYGKNLKVMPAVAHNYGMGKPFTNKELTKIILDKNEVIADLEKNAYGEGFWDDVRAGLIKHNQRKKTTPISEEDWKKQMEDYEKPTENWGADELGGGAAPAAKPEPPSAVAAAAAALQPVRTAIQNGIGDAIYGKSDDPKKQKKGLLGISEEGKEESKKKVMKNIVAPLAKTAMGLKKSMTDTWNLMFNKDQYNADMKAALIKRIKKEEAEMGIVRDKTDPKLIVRKPRGLYKTETTDPEVESYRPIAHRDDSAKAKEFMIRVPNPLFGIVKPTSKTLAEAGIKLWAGVNSFKDDDIDYSLRALQNDKFMWIPEDRAKELYPKLRQFAADEQDKGLAEGFEDFGWSKGEMKQFAKIDPRTLTGIDLIEYKQAKLLQDKQVAKNALEKVTKDIAEEEKGKTIIRGERPVRIEPDQARLAKMREAKVRVEKRLVDLAERGKQDFKDMTMFAEADKAKRDQEYYAKQAADAVGREDAIDEEQADFAALPAEERIAQLEEFIVQLREQGAPEWQIDQFDQQVRNVEEEVEEEEETRQAQGSVELLQQAEVAGGTKPCWKGYEMIGMKKKGKRTVPNCVPIGGEEFSDRSSVGSDSDNSSDGEMEGGGMVEFALAKAGKLIYNPDGDMTKAGRSTFTPDWDAYGEDAASGRQNAFNLSRSMYIQGKALELPGFKMVKDDTSLRFYRKDDENVMLVGIRGTDVHSWTDLYTWAVIGRGIGEDLRWTTRFQEDLEKLIRFQRNYPPSQFYYVATGSSLAGSIADRFLELGIIEEAVTYNPSIEKKFILEENLLNHRIYLDTDPLFILMGQYAPNTEIRKNASRVDYYNPIKEKDQLVKSHSIYPLYNAAFEGGGMEGGGKTYTIEEWKAIFDAKLEQKRQQIEAREAKKKATAKAKRARAKVRRDERGEIPELETPFRTSRVMKATPPKEPEPEPEPAEQPPPADPPAPPAPKKRKPKLKVVAPASARVELREELVAEQPRSPGGEFAKPAEVAVMAVDQAPQRSYMKLMKSPVFTAAERKLLTRIRETQMTPVMKAKLLARSGLARKVMELMGMNTSAFQTPREQLRIADKMEKRVETKKASAFILPKVVQDYLDLKEKQARLKLRQLRTERKQTQLDKKGIEEVEDTVFKYIGNATRFGLGAIEVVRNAFQDDPFGYWYAMRDHFVKVKASEIPSGHTKAHLIKLERKLTKREENQGLATPELGGAEIVMNWDEEKYPLVELTDVMLGLLKEDGVACFRSTARGIGRDHTGIWFCGMIGRESVKRWTEVETQKWLMIGKNEILPRLEERVSALRPLFESATKKAREGAESELNAIERKTLQDVRAERKKQAEEVERTKSVKRYKADERMAAIRDNFSRGGQYEMTGDPFNFSPRLDHYFTDKLGNRVSIRMEWGGDWRIDQDMTSWKINKLWRDLGRMDAEKNEEELNLLQREAIEILAKINPAENTKHVVGFSVKRPNGERFIPESYIDDWVLREISPAQRNLKTNGLGFHQTGGEKPTNAEEDEFYGFMCAVIRKNAKGKGQGYYRGHNFNLKPEDVLPQLVAECSNWGTASQRRIWQGEWEEDPGKFMKFAFGRSLELGYEYETKPK